MKENQDILKSVSGLKERPYVVGFAAETDNLLENARKKLKKKKLDLIIANDVSADHTCAYTSGTGTNRLTFQVASQTLATGDVMTIGGANVVLAGGTLKDQGGTPADASLVMSGVTAVTHTVLA